MSKHTSPSETKRIAQVWSSMPSQLSKENKKFVYGVVREGGRAKDFEIAIQWLADAGLVHKVPRVSSLSMPLMTYGDFSAFKLYLLDVGLLGALSNTPGELLLMPNNMGTSSGFGRCRAGAGRRHACPPKGNRRPIRRCGCPCRAIPLSRIPRRPYVSAGRGVPRPLPILSPPPPLPGVLFRLRFPVGRKAACRCVSPLSFSRRATAGSWP